MTIKQELSDYFADSKLEINYLTPYHHFLHQYMFIHNLGTIEPRGNPGEIVVERLLKMKNINFDLAIDDVLDTVADTMARNDHFVKILASEYGMELEDIDSDAVYFFIIDEFHSTKELLREKREDDPTTRRFMEYLRQGSFTVDNILKDVYLKDNPSFNSTLQKARLYKPPKKTKEDKLLEQGQKAMDYFRTEFVRKAFFKVDKQREYLDNYLGNIGRNHPQREPEYKYSSKAEAERAFIIYEGFERSYAGLLLTILRGDYEDYGEKFSEVALKECEVFDNTAGVLHEEADFVRKEQKSFPTLDISTSLKVK